MAGFDYDVGEPLLSTEGPQLSSVARIVIERNVIEAYKNKYQASFSTESNLITALDNIAGELASNLRI